jgi:hypothetical protein
MPSDRIHIGRDQYQVESFLTENHNMQRLAALKGRVDGARAALSDMAWIPALLSALLYARPAPTQQPRTAGSKPCGPGVVGPKRFR